MKEIEYISPNELGAVVTTKTEGRKTLVVREYGIEQLTRTLDPTRTKIELIAKSPRRIIDLKQIKYIIKRRKKKWKRTF